MTSRLPVAAVVPNYNMADSLKELVPTLLNGGYDSVYVLDDASTDHSADVIADFGNDVNGIIGQENVGSGANRNRIISVLGSESVIHFIDADMVMETPDPAEIVSDWVNSPSVGFTGGLIKREDGRQATFNYGPRHCLYTDMRGLLLVYIDRLEASDPDKATKLRSRYEKALEWWPNPEQEPVERTVFWAAEANFVIKSAIFEALGGFDTNMRAQEVLEFSMRVRKAGLEGRFNPAVSALHKAIQVRSGNRDIIDLQHMAYVVRKHGLKNYFLPEGKFRPEL